jgi:hypothetical protein
LLGHEEGVEVPESSVDESVRLTLVAEVCRDRGQNSPASRHLNETLVEKDLAELLTHFHQGMQSTSMLLTAHSSKVIRLEVCSLPLARLQHFRRQVCMLNRHFLCVLVALGNDVADDLVDGDELAFLKVGEEFVVREGLGCLDGREGVAGCVFGRVDEGDEDIAVFLDPLELEGVALAHLERICSNLILLHLCQSQLHFSSDCQAKTYLKLLQRHLPSLLNSIPHLELMTTLVGNLLTLLGKYNLLLIIGLVDNHVPRGQSVQSSLDLCLSYIGEVALGRNALFGVEKVQYFLGEIAPGGLSVHRYGATLSDHVCVV